MKIFGLEIRRTKAKGDIGHNLVWTPNGWVNNISNVEQILTEAGANATVYSIIDAMQKKFASIPWLFYEIKDQNKAKAYKSLTNDYSPHALFDKLKLKQSAFNEISNHKALERWEQPNDNQTGQEFRGHALTSLKYTGAAPIWANMGGTRISPLEMHVLGTRYIRLQPATDLTSFDKAFYTPTGEQIPIDLQDFLYWKYTNPHFSRNGTHLYGLPPLKAAASILGIDRELFDSVGFNYKNKGSLGAFTPKDKEGMIEAIKNSEKLKKTVEDKTNGRASELVRSFVNFPLDYHNFGQTAVEQETIKMAGLTTEKLAFIFNFPTLLAQMATGTDNRYDAAIKYMVTNTIYSDLTSMRDWANRWFLGLFGLDNKRYYFDFDVTALAEMQEDMQKLVTSLDKMWWITPNERRLVSKYDADANPLMDKILIPTNLQPLEAAFDAGTNIDPALL